MIKPNKPNSVNDVLDVMKEYIKKKGYKFTDSKIMYLAEDCYLCFESRGWKGVTYWPAAAMRWVLNNYNKQVNVERKYIPRYETKKSVRDIIMETEQKDEV